MGLDITIGITITKGIVGRRFEWWLTNTSLPSAFYRPFHDSSSRCRFSRLLKAGCEMPRIRAAID